MPEITIEQALQLPRALFLDVRSPKEFEESHIVGAVNWPILDNLEREAVGIIYKQRGKQEAVETGLDAVQGKLKDFYTQMIGVSGTYDHVVLYCSRGGMRSDSLYHFGLSLGFRNLHKLQGGYKAYRNHVIATSETMLSENPLAVVHGPTGVGKTLILEELEKAGIPVINLEVLAQNAGSVFGFIPFDRDPPSQKMFENMVFDKLRTLERPIFVESESRRIGRVTLTKGFLEAMKRGAHLKVDTSLENRIRVISDLYDPVFQSDEVVKAIGFLRKQMGNAKVDQLLQWVAEKDYRKVISTLITDYYDPLYQYSIRQYEPYVRDIMYREIPEAVQEIIQYYNEVHNETNRPY